MADRLVEESLGYWSTRFCAGSTIPVSEVASSAERIRNLKAREGSGTSAKRYIAGAMRIYAKAKNSMRHFLAAQTSHSFTYSTKKQNTNIRGINSATSDSMN
jgi:hypothetical protein